jgi:hypothetical protein
MTRRFPDQFHSATNAELSKQRRHMKFYRAFGEIQRRSDFLIGQAAHHAAKHFLFTAR